MPTMPRAALLILPLAVSACGLLPQRDKGPLPPPNAPVYCYDTLGRPACYDEPQLGLGELINQQVPKPKPVVVVAPAPVVVAPVAGTTATVLTPAQIESIPDNATAVVTTTEEPPIVIHNPDPYPEPGNQATTGTKR